MTLTTTANLRVQTTLTNPLDLVTPSAPQMFQYLLEMTSGVGLNQADAVWSDRRTVAASTTDSLDLAGSLETALGVAFTPARIKGLILRNRGVQNLALTRPAAAGVPWLTAAGDAIIIVPGGINIWFAPSAAGIAVTATTADLIDVVNGAGVSVDYDIVIIGATA
jgi:hypothetical protein